jgi:hypothetical protein
VLCCEERGQARGETPAEELQHRDSHRTGPKGMLLHGTCAGKERLVPLQKGCIRVTGARGECDWRRGRGPAARARPVRDNVMSTRSTDRCDLEAPCNILPGVGTLPNVPQSLHPEEGGTHGLLTAQMGRCLERESKAGRLKASRTLKGERWSEEMPGDTPDREVATQQRKGNTGGGFPREGGHNCLGCLLVLIRGGG